MLWEPPWAAAPNLPAHTREFIWEPGVGGFVLVSVTHLPGGHLIPELHELTRNEP